MSPPSFSHRTAWDRSPNGWSLALAAHRASGRRTLDLTESNPTRAGLRADPAALAAAFASPLAVQHEPEPLGLPSAREAIARWWTARGVPADPARMMLTASTSEAYALLFKLLCDPGDAVMAPMPSYPLFDDLARLDSVEILPYRLREADGWRIDVDSLAARLTEKARAVMVVHPNNPTGSLLREDEARAIARLCASRGLALVSDEVFAEFAWTDVGAPRSLLGIGDEEGALTFAMSGLSKPCGLPQLKLGWTAISGPGASVGEAMARLEHVADTYLSVATPVQLGVERLLALGDAFRERLRGRLQANRETLAVAIAATGARVRAADAGWTALVELPDGIDESALAEQLLLEDGVLVQPGWFFDLPGGHVVVSLIVEEDVMAEGARALASAVGG